jgi:hypothetical protein
MTNRPRNVLQLPSPISGPVYKITGPVYKRNDTVSSGAEMQLRPWQQVTIAIVIAVVLSACALVWDDDDDVQECLSFGESFIVAGCK